MPPLTWAAAGVTTRQLAATRNVQMGSFMITVGSQP
jgi:hypothetical protein